jgi:hypothetical protein
MMLLLDVARVGLELTGALTICVVLLVWTDARRLARMPRRAHGRWWERAR